MERIGLMVLIAIIKPLEALFKLVVILMNMEWNGINYDFHSKIYMLANV